MIAQEDQNLFELSQEQRVNINKRLPIGFSLAKLTERSKFEAKPFKGAIKYVPTKPQPKIVNFHQSQRFPIPPIPSAIKSQSSSQLTPQNHTSVLSTVKKPSEDSLNLNHPLTMINTISKMSSGISQLKPKHTLHQLPQNKSRQSQKIKIIIQRLRKHNKFPSLALQMNKFGMLTSFSEIQTESKKNLHTIDSFKQRCMFIFNTMKNVIISPTTMELLDEMIEEFLCYVEEAKKNEFEQNLQGIQKSIDKITREISDTKEQGNWYVRKKKKSQKTFEEKQILHIAELIKQLPKAYLVGVWQIVEEKPFPESSIDQLQIDYTSLKQKKLRELEFYAKKKLTNLLRSRQRKKQKMMKKKEEKRQKRVQDKQAQQKEKLQSEQKIQSQEKVQNEDKEVDKSQKGYKNIFKTLEKSQQEEKEESRSRGDFSYNKQPKNEVLLSPKSHGSRLAVPATPSFNPKKGRELPSFHNLNVKNQSASKKPIFKDEMDELFGDEVVPSRNSNSMIGDSVDDFLDLGDYNIRDRSEKPRAPDSPLWGEGQDLEENLLNKSPVRKPSEQNIFDDIEEPYPSRPMAKNNSIDLEFEPINVGNLTAQRRFTNTEQENLERKAEDAEKSEINPPSFDQGDPSFIGNKEEENLQEEDSEEQESQEQYDSSDSSMITDEDDSDY